MNYSLNPPKGGTKSAKNDSNSYLDSIAGSGSMADIMAMMKKQVCIPMSVCVRICACVCLEVRQCLRVYVYAAVLLSTIEATLILAGFLVSLLVSPLQGINLDGFEAEAEDIWKSLDNMSENDPDEYRKFIQNQYQDSLEEDAKGAKDKTGAANPNNPSTNNSSNGSKASKEEKKSEDEDRFFRPIVGFSIKTKTSDGDGLKVRAEGDGKELYINFCSHPAIEAPIDRNGKPVDMRDFYRQRLPDGLQVWI